LAGGPDRLGFPPQELRDAPWRSSLAPDDVWERFDEALESLSRARTGVSVVAIAQAFGQLSGAAWGLADALEQRRPRQRASRARRADPSERKQERHAHNRKQTEPNDQPKPHTKHDDPAPRKLREHNPVH